MTSAQLVPYPTPVRRLCFSQSTKYPGKVRFLASELYLKLLNASAFFLTHQWERPCSAHVRNLNLHSGESETGNQSPKGFLAGPLGIELCFCWVLRMALERPPPEKQQQTTLRVTAWVMPTVSTRTAWPHPAPTLMPPPAGRSTAAGSWPCPAFTELISCRKDGLVLTGSCLSIQLIMPTHFQANCASRVTGC